MAGIFTRTLTFCGIIRKENRRALPLTACGQQLFKVIKFQNNHSKTVKTFLQ
jgi:hypothetical protein